MIQPMRLSDVSTPLNGQLFGDDVTFTRVNTDTRTIKDGDLFVALRGVRFDAHDFLIQACESGAVAVVVEHYIDDLPVPQLLVDDTTRALGDLAHLARLQFNGPLVALTGSCGKTTVKEMLAAVLEQASAQRAGAGRVHVTRGNLNNHIGVPQTLLAMQAGTEYAVIEMGASGPGEIDYLASMAEPEVALVNNVMAAHLQGFGSEAGVAAEKSNIYRRLRQQGTAVINLDERYASAWLQELSEQRPDLRCLTFSDCIPEADVFADQIHLDELGGYQFQLHYGAEVVSIVLPVLGRQNVNNALAVSACCLAIGVPMPIIANGLAQVRAVAGRLAPLSGIHDALVVDDTYNANPGSVKAAARVLMDFSLQGRDVVMVLGDLGELGQDEIVALNQLGRDLQGMGIPRLLTQGQNSLHACNGFNKALHQVALQPHAGQSEAQHFQTQDDVIRVLLKQLTQNTVVLVKGSRSARMEGVVQAITVSGEPS